jgi:hypothetical protein
VLEYERPADHRVRFIGAVLVPWDMKILQHADHQFRGFRLRIDVQDDYLGRSVT